MVLLIVLHKVELTFKTVDESVIILVIAIRQPPLFDAV